MILCFLTDSTNSIDSQMVTNRVHCGSLRAGRRNSRFTSSGYRSFRQFHTDANLAGTPSGVASRTPLTSGRKISNPGNDSQKVTPVLYRTSDSLQKSFAAKHLRSMQPPRSLRGTTMVSSDELCASPELSSASSSKSTNVTPGELLIDNY